MGYSGVGASTSCYGLVGASMARTGLVWLGTTDMEYRSQIQGAMVTNVGMLFAWEVIFWKEIDRFGHLGGCISGFCIGLMQAKRVPLAERRELPEQYSQWDKFSKVALVVLVVACILRIFVW